MVKTNHYLAALWPNWIGDKRQKMMDEAAIYLHL
jgi:hypothetical protein